jgi:L-threonylcarbamoyladenylate synthase
MSNTSHYLWHLKYAATTLKSGGVIACATESVWGLSCSIAHESAMAHVIDIKQRSMSKGLIVVCSEFSQIVDLIQPLSSDQWEKINAPVTHPTTWILPCNKSVSHYIKGRYQSIAVRKTTHPELLSLCQSVGPLISTSANIAGHHPARSAILIRKNFYHTIDYIYPSQLGGYAKASVIKTLDGTQLR